MTTTTAAVRTLLTRLPPGRLVTTAGLGKSIGQPVDKVLSPLSKELGLIKLRNGIYWKPKTSPIFKANIVSIDEVERAVSEQYHALLYRTGQWAAHRYLLALEPEVITYETDKRLAPFVVNGRDLTFRQVRKERLTSADRALGELLNAIEWWLDATDASQLSTRRYIGLLLQEFTPDQRARALRHRRPKVRAFCESEAPTSESVRYITGWSALNIPMSNGDVADWHTEAVVRSGKLIVAGDNHPIAPGLKPEDLRDITDFIHERNLSCPTHLCANPERAVVDLVFHAIFTLGVDPNVYIDDLMVDIDRTYIKRQLKTWIPNASTAQHGRLEKWMRDNDIDERTNSSRETDPSPLSAHP